DGNLAGGFALSHATDLILGVLNVGGDVTLNISGDLLVDGKVDVEGEANIQAERVLSSVDGEIEADRLAVTTASLGSVVQALGLDVDEINLQIQRDLLGNVRRVIDFSAAEFAANETVVMTIDGTDYTIAAGADLRTSLSAIGAAQEDIKVDDLRFVVTGSLVDKTITFASFVGGEANTETEDSIDAISDVTETLERDVINFSQDGDQTIERLINDYGLIAISATGDLTIEQEISAADDLSLLADGAVVMQSQSIIRSRTGSVSIEGGQAVNQGSDGFIDADLDVTVLSTNGTITLNGFVEPVRKMIVNAGVDLLISDHIETSSSVELTSGANLYLQGRVDAGTTVAMTAGDNIELSSSLKATDNISVVAKGEAKVLGAIQATSLDMNVDDGLILRGAVATTGDLNLSGLGALTLNDVVSSGADMAIDMGGDIILSENVSAEGSLLIDGAGLTALGTLEARGGPLVISVDGSVALFGRLLAQEELRMIVGQYLQMSDVSVGERFYANAGSIVGLSSVDAGTSVMMYAQEGLSLFGTLRAVDNVQLTAMEGGLFAQAQLQSTAGDVVLYGGSSVNLQDSVKAGRGNIIIFGENIVTQDVV
ncbi:MAG: hypothetical protein ACPGJH_09590, partial [Alphaproteobacteria bacterium]